MSAPDEQRQIAAMHLKISGRVQGVGFRWSLQRKAIQLGLSGWVRNCADGSVEAVAAGPKESLHQLQAWAQHGPPAARVDKVLASPWSGEWVDGRFEQRPTV